MLQILAGVQISTGLATNKCTVSRFANIVTSLHLKVMFLGASVCLHVCLLTITFIHSFYFILVTSIIL